MPVDAWRDKFAGDDTNTVRLNLFQLLLRGQTRYYAAGTIIADSREKANGMYVVTSGQVPPASFVPAGVRTVSGWSAAT